MLIKKVLVTGAAGFIGSNLCDELLQRNYEVVGYDNFSTGFSEFVDKARENKRFKIIQGDILDTVSLFHAMHGCDFVFHLSANADIRNGLEKTNKDLEQNTIGTFNVIDAARMKKVGGIAFSSTGSVYGEPTIFPTPENAPFPIQTSLYAASKLAGEGLLQAYAEGFGIQTYIFRFVSILGERYTHGHVFDFLKQLKTNPNELKVLGNGKQKKSYLYVKDCISAMLIAIEKSNNKINIFNLGCDHYCEVNDSIHWICERLGVNPNIIYTNGDRGWIGDSPFIFLDTKRIRDLGWFPKLNIKDGVIATVDYLSSNTHLLDKR